MKIQASTSLVILRRNVTKISRILAAPLAGMQAVRTCESHGAMTVAHIVADLQQKGIHFASTNDGGFSGYGVWGHLGLPV